MSNSSIFSGSGAENNDDGFVVLNEAERADSDIPGDSAEVRTALPVVVDDEDDDDEYRRTAIDLDDLGTGSSRQPLDLGSLIGQLSERANRPRPQTPPAQPSVRAPAQTAPIRPPTQPDQTDNQSEIARLKGELEKERNNVRRGMADLINYRRKAETDRQRYVQDAIEGFAKKVVEVMDDFERGLRTTSDTKNYDLLADGIQAVMRNFNAMLGGYGIKEIETVGNLFDVEQHEAIGTDAESDLPEDTIVEELRKGYTIDGRLLRAAMVKVARKDAAGLDTTGAESGVETDSAGESPATAEPVEVPAEAETVGSVSEADSEPSPSQ